MAHFARHALNRPALEKRRKALPQPNIGEWYLLTIFNVVLKVHDSFGQLLMTSATYKSTALKALILWNLPALLVFTGALQAGTSINV